MSKLREKFENELNKGFIMSEQCEQIADDFAVKFAEWKDKNITKVFGHYIFNNEANNWNNKTYSITELLQIFKDKYYE